MNVRELYRIKIELRSLVNKCLELARADKYIGSSEEAIVSVVHPFADELQIEDLIDKEVSLNYLLQVESVVFVKECIDSAYSVQEGDIWIGIAKSLNLRCERCRKGYEHNKLIQLNLCFRCYEILRNGIVSGDIAWNNDGYFWADAYHISESDRNHLPISDHLRYWKENYNLEVEFALLDAEWEAIKQKEIDYKRSFRSRESLDEYDKKYIEDYLRR